MPEAKPKRLLYISKLYWGGVVSSRQFYSKTPEFYLLPFKVLGNHIKNKVISMLLLYL